MRLVVEERIMVDNHSKKLSQTIEKTELLDKEISVSSSKFPKSSSYKEMD